MNTEKQGRERRRFTRYKVAQLPSLRASIDPNRPHEQIATLSLGGCGFYGSEKSKPLTPGQIVETQLEYDEDPSLPKIKVRGKVVYTRVLDIMGFPVNFYGVEFIPEDQARVTPLIEVLEVLKTNKKVEAT